METQIVQRPTLTFLRNASPRSVKEFSSMPKAIIYRRYELPNSFDGRTVWKGLLSPVKNQARCGSCWAFASTTTLADRFNIQSVGKMHIDLSPAKLILCDFGSREFDIEHPEIELSQTTKINALAFASGACHGNTLYDSWRYLFTIGTTTESCTPYTKGLTADLKTFSLSEYRSDDLLPFCSTISGSIGDMCSDFAFNTTTGDEYGTPARFYRCIHFYSVPGIEADGGDESHIRHEIYSWGPVSTGMKVYPDFYTFDPKTEIYEWNGEGEEVGGHAVELVGWGERNGKKYWIVRNSWGEDWGMKGYFYMSRGDNNCNLEENVITGLPDFFYPIGYDIINPNRYKWGETPEIKSQRKQIETRLTITGGGIDPTTGFTRRVMSDKPWKNVSPPIDYRELPDWQIFIAGRDSYQKTNRRGYTAWVWFIFFLALLVIFVCIYRKNRQY